MLPWTDWRVEGKSSFIKYEELECVYKITGRSHWKEKGLSPVIGPRFLRRWQGMEPGGRMSLRRKENPLCEADEEETRVDTDADKRQVVRE